MFIALVGGRGSGKGTVQDYFVNRHGFRVIGVGESQGESGDDLDDPESWRDDDKDSDIIPLPTHANRDSFLDINSPTTPFTARMESHRNHFGVPEEMAPLLFSNTDEMLDFATKNWRERLITTGLNRKSVLEEFAIRPFFMLLQVDAPILKRFDRSRREAHVTLEAFVAEDDRLLYGYSKPAASQETQSSQSSSLYSLQPLVHLNIFNDFDTIDQFHDHLDGLNLLDQDRLRPAWDTYFMRLASLASLRSNCMKRRVGAILVRNNRIVATGYNGTARGLRNCNEGGCSRCNGSSLSGHALDECVCLHAEENALLEAGRERIDSTVLYCNTCPCLRCTVKIIQTGVKEVVYNLSYRVDDASAALFREAGIRLRRFAPPP